MLFLLCVGSRRRPTLKKSKNDLLNPDEGDGDLALGNNSTYSVSVILFTFLLIYWKYSLSNISQYNDTIFSPIFMFCLTFSSLRLTICSCQLKELQTGGLIFPKEGATSAFLYPSCCENTGFLLDCSLFSWSEHVVCGCGPL